jgi:hypothetical protein
VFRHRKGLLSIDKINNNDLSVISELQQSAGESMVKEIIKSFKDIHKLQPGGNLLADTSPLLRVMGSEDQTPNVLRSNKTGDKAGTTMIIPDYELKI